MSSDIVLTAGIKQNLLSLQQTTQLQQTIQERLSSGKKVNSALDNAVNFFTSASLNARSNELSSLLDAMTNAVNTLKAADTGLTSITTTIQSMQATVTQARLDTSWQSASYTLDSASIGTTTGFKVITFQGGAVGSTPISIDLKDQQTISATYTAPTSAYPAIQASDINGGNSVSVAVGTSDTISTVAANISAAVGDNLASGSGGTPTLQDANLQQITVGGNSAAPGFSSTTSTGAPGAAGTVDQLVTAINNNIALAGKVKASDNAGQLQITNLWTSPLTLTGISLSTGKLDGSAGTASVSGNTVRANLIAQFNQLRDQLDKAAADSSFNGVNLLTGDVLKLLFNELGTSTLSIQSTNANGISSSTLGISAATGAEFQSNSALDARLQQLQTALGTVAAQASDFGSNLSIVQNRQEFTNNMINTLRTGADGLTLADTNEEGANMLALQTRQQLSITALSLASQANQSVLKLFG